jgi:epoxyqueuosine reductase
VVPRIKAYRQVDAMIPGRLRPSRMKRGSVEVEIQELLGHHDVDAAGVADLSRYGKEILGIDKHAIDRYTYAISFGLVISRNVLETLTDGPTLFYQHHYRQINYRLDMIAYLLAREIEQKGFNALPFAASQMIDWQDQKAHISHKHIGEIAGTGWIGRNNLLVHPVFGAHVRYNTVLTDMPLQAGGPLETGCGTCTSCMEACPVQAIKTERDQFDHKGCFAMLKRFKNERGLGHHICGICVRACRGKR